MKISWVKQNGTEGNTILEIGPKKIKEKTRACNQHNQQKPTTSGESKEQLL
jgi:hypothetical protein